MTARRRVPPAVSSTTQRPDLRDARARGTRARHAVRHVGRRRRAPDVVPPRGIDVRRGAACSSPRRSRAGGGWLGIEDDDEAAAGVRRAGACAPTSPASERRRTLGGHRRRRRRAQGDRAGPAAQERRRRRSPGLRGAARSRAPRASCARRWRRRPRRRRLRRPGHGAARRRDARGRRRRSRSSDPSWPAARAARAVELLGDVQVRLAPVAPSRGDRHDPRPSHASRCSTATATLRVPTSGPWRTSSCASAWLAANHPEIAELDLNPVIVAPTGATAVDARVRVERPARRPPYPAVGR